MSIMSFMMRRGCKKSDAKRDAGLVYPNNVVRVEDISYGPHKMNILDVCLKSEAITILNTCINLQQFLPFLNRFLPSLNLSL